MSEEAKVAARLMGQWETDPFTREVPLGARWPDCPFRSGSFGCSLAKVRGASKEWVRLVCPEKDKTFQGHGPPEMCPLRYGEVVVRGVEGGNP